MLYELSASGMLITNTLCISPAQDVPTVMYIILLSGGICSSELGFQTIGALCIYWTLDLIVHGVGGNLVVCLGDMLWESIWD